MEGIHLFLSVVLTTFKPLCFGDLHRMGEAAGGWECGEGEGVMEMCKGNSILNSKVEILDGIKSR